MYPITMKSFKNRRFSILRLLITVINSDEEISDYLPFKIFILYVAACFLRIKYQQDKNSGNLMFHKMSCPHENEVCNVFLLFQLKMYM